MLKLSYFEEDEIMVWIKLGITSMGTCFIIDGAVSEEPKRRHDVTFPLLT
jgi:hypothetical protein